jgi:hypothetical protein
MQFKLCCSTKSWIFFSEHHKFWSKSFFGQNLHPSNKIRAYTTHVNDFLLADFDHRIHDIGKIYETFPYEIEKKALLVIS